MTHHGLSRRLLLKRAIVLSMLAAIERLIPACAVTPTTSVISGSRSPLSGAVIDLIISEQSFLLDGHTATAMTFNGNIPGPVVRLKDGQQATLRVTNHLEESTSIHWHGILLPHDMDGVPGVSFADIKPGTTFTYRFPVKQSGTYWFHSHLGGQEMLGLYAPMIIDPVTPDPFRYEREYVVMLSDWSFESPETLFSNPKKQAGYYNFQKRAAGEFFTDVRRLGFWPAIQNYLLWDQMRMDPTDFADVTAYSLTYLMNGLSPIGNWTGLFRPGERVRLRFINGASTTFYDVRIPGLMMTVVQADGQNIQPVVVDEFRMGVAETYDVIVEPVEDLAYTIFAETIDRSGYARGTPAPRAGMSGEIPPRRHRPLRTMADMGMPMDHMRMAGLERSGEQKHSHGGDMTMSGTAPSGEMPSTTPSGDKSHMGHGSGVQSKPGMHEMPGSTARDPHQSDIPGAEPVKHGPDDHGPGMEAGMFRIVEVVA